jgi:hypothetical protein
MRNKNAIGIGLLLGLLLVFGLTVTPAAQSTATQIQIAINQLVTGVTPFTAFRTATSSYLNWGSTQGEPGYGIRDSGGNIQIKNNAGTWTTVVGASGNPIDGSYITRVPETSLTNESPLSALATGILFSTTGTGVPSIYTGTSCTNQFVRSLSTAGVATCNTVILSTDTTGTLAVARGGTGLTSGTSGGVLAFVATGAISSSAELLVNRIVIGGGAGAVPTVVGSLGTTTTVLHGNAGGAPTFGAVSLTADVTGILPSANGGTNNAFFTVSGPAATVKTYTLPNANTTILTTNAAVTAVQGGTGQTVYAVGDLLQADTTTTLQRLAAVATGNALISGGVGTISSWGKIGLTTHVSGTLGATNGGTGQAAYTTGDLLYANSGTTLARLASVAAGSFLRSAGVGTAPAWSTTVWTNTATTGDLLAASAANTYSNITAVAVGQVLASAGVGVLPAWTTSPTVTSLRLLGTLTLSGTAPTISAGFGAGAAITAGTSAAFRVDVGAASMSGTIGLPTATTGWNCYVENLTATTANRADARTVQLSSTTATAVLESQTVSTGAAVNWGANDILAVNCVAF